LLLRSDGISKVRYNQSFEWLAQWSADTPCIATDRSTGKQTARSALVMRAIDAEIRSETREKASLDTLVQKLMRENQGITNSSFRAAITELTGAPVRALSDCP
jgi:predicted metalloprotease with PDZ domain